MTHEQFEKTLEDIGYEVSKENLGKLIQAFTTQRIPDKVTKNLIKRNINLLAPDVISKEGISSKRQVDDRLDTLNPKVKNTLKKISEYLKRERMDTLTFFDKCDEDGDGMLGEDEF